MQSVTKPKVTCYSEGEDGFMRKSQELRGNVLRPLLAVLARCAITPNHLTLLSLLTGLAFCPLFLRGRIIAACSALLAHVVLDGLDGPLARFTGRSSNQGSFADTASDQVVVTVTTITMIHAGYAGLWSGVLYLFFYSIVVIFAMVRNALAIPYSWLVRPRFFVYLGIPVSVYWWRNTLDVMLWLFALLLGIKTLTGFIKIRRQM